MQDTIFDDNKLIGNPDANIVKLNPPINAIARIKRKIQSNIFFITPPRRKLCLLVPVACHSYLTNQLDILLGYIHTHMIVYATGFHAQYQVYGY